MKICLLAAAIQEAVPGRRSGRLLMICLLQIAAPTKPLDRQQLLHHRLSCESLLRKQRSSTRNVEEGLVLFYGRDIVHQMRLEDSKGESQISAAQP